MAAAWLCTGYHGSHFGTATAPHARQLRIGLPARLAISQEGSRSVQDTGHPLQPAVHLTSWVYYSLGPHNLQGPSKKISELWGGG